MAYLCHVLSHQKMQQEPTFLHEFFYTLAAPHKGKLFLRQIERSKGRFLVHVATSPQHHDDDASLRLAKDVQIEHICTALALRCDQSPRLNLSCNVPYRLTLFGCSTKLGGYGTANLLIMAGSAARLSQDQLRDRFFLSEQNVSA